MHPLLVVCLVTIGLAVVIGALVVWAAVVVGSRADDEMGTEE